MDATLLSNVAAFSLQLACIVAIATLPPLLVRSDPGVRDVYWRAVLLLCLVLPWVQGREPVADAVTSTFAIAAITETADGETAAASSGFSLHTPSLLLALFLAGVVVRGSRVALGLWRLRRLRAAGEPADDDDEFEELQRMIGTRASVRYVADLPQPATFGVLRPIVLLPASLRERSAALRRAVLGHELFHVRRRDWAWILLEQAALTLFWFHPAAWWLVSRLDRAREEAVDAMAVLVAGSRKTYVEALLAFADDAAPVPAAAFSRRAHLFRRIVLLSQGGVMSSRAVVLSGVALTLIVSAGSLYAVRAFPLAAAAQASAIGPGPLERRARPLTPENPVPRRIYSVMPEFPATELEAPAPAIPVRITLDRSGHVAEARPGDAMPVLIRSLASVETRTPVSEATLAVTEARARIEKQLEPFVEAALGAVRHWQYDPPAEAPLAFTVVFHFTRQRVTAVQEANESPLRQATLSASSSPAGGIARTPIGPANALRVGGGVAPPTKIVDVRPVYPEEARAAHVQGIVIIEAAIDTDGRVVETRVLRSLPLLDQAALDAVRHWQFTPTLMNGQPIPVIMTMTVNFTLD